MEKKNKKQQLQWFIILLLFLSVCERETDRVTDRDGEKERESHMNTRTVEEGKGRHQVL